MRAAIYARMSTDKQSEASPEDQVNECRRFAEAKGWEVADELVVREAGVSGASRHNRPGLLELVARIDSWDVLLCFESARLARNGEDFNWILNRLRTHRRQGFEVSTGLELSNMGSRVMSVLNEEYLLKLRADIRRGLRGQLERGLVPGAVPYGFRLEASPTEDGRRNSRLVVEPEAAATVRRIFELYATGEGVKAIAHRLNGEGVPSPRPRALRARPASWAPSSIREMLKNRLYRGDLVWNRSEWIKDHATGRRPRHERPESEWVVQRDEAWQIVPEALWQAVRERAAERQRGMRERGGRKVPASAVNPRARHLLSGLLACGACCGSFHALRANGVYGCQWHRDRGPAVCASDLRVPGPELEGRVLSALREEILVPEHVAYVAARAAQRLRERRREPEAEARAELRDLDGQAERLSEAIAAGGELQALMERLKAVEARRKALRGRVSELGPPSSPRRPSESAWRALCASSTASSPAAAEGARRMLRHLLHGRRLAVRPDAERYFAVEGLLRLSLDAGTPRATQGAGAFTRMVAGVRFRTGLRPLRVPFVA